MHACMCPGLKHRHCFGCPCRLRAPQKGGPHSKWYAAMPAVCLSAMILYAVCWLAVHRRMRCQRPAGPWLVHACACRRALPAGVPFLGHCTCGAAKACPHPTAVASCMPSTRAQPCMHAASRACMSLQIKTSRQPVLPCRLMAPRVSPPASVCACVCLCLRLCRVCLPLCCKRLLVAGQLQDSPIVVLVRATGLLPCSHLLHMSPALGRKCDALHAGCDRCCSQSSTRRPTNLKVNPAHTLRALLLPIFPLLLSNPTVSHGSLPFHHQSGSLLELCHWSTLGQAGWKWLGQIACIVR